MRSLYAILAFEISQRRLALVASAAVGAFPWLGPILQDTASPADLRIATATTGAVLLGWSLAILLGSTAIGPDLASGRLSLFFSQPVSALSIWAGKLGAATAISMASMALVLLPILLFEPQAWAEPARDQVVGTLLLGVFIPALVVAAHVLSILLRSRNVWLALPLTTGLGLGLVLVASCARLEQAGARILVPFVGACVAAVIVGGAITASLVQVVRGRSDPDRAVRVLCLGLSGTALVAALGAGWYAHWATAAEIEDLRGVHGANRLGEEWVLAVGPVSGRPGLDAAFLLERTGTGAVEPSIRALPFRFGAALWSRRDLQWAVSDGAMVVFGDIGGKGPALWWADLKADRPSAETTGVVMPGRPETMRLSPSGRRLAVVGSSALPGAPSRLWVHELPSGRVLTTHDLPAEVDLAARSDWDYDLRFIGEERLRLVTLARRDGAWAFVRLSMEVGSPQIDDPVWTEDLRITRPWEAKLSANGEWAVAPQGLYLTASGARIRSFKSAARRIDRHPLNDGRLIERELGWAARVVDGRSGAVQSSLPTEGWFGLAAELSSGALVFTSGRDYLGCGTGYSPSAWLLSPNDDELRLLHDEIYRVFATGRDSVLIVDTRGSLTELIPSTGESRRWIDGDLDLDNRRAPHPRSRVVSLLRAWWPG